MSWCGADTCLYSATPSIIATLPEADRVLQDVFELQAAVPPVLRVDAAWAGGGFELTISLADGHQALDQACDGRLACMLRRLMHLPDDRPVWPRDFDSMRVCAVIARLQCGHPGVSSASATHR
jgi:hypothetical protein